MNEHSLLYDLKHVFREKRSCDIQLTKLVEDLARYASRRKQTDLIFLEFFKVFDKVSHSKLIWKLQLNGERPNALRWVQAFLGNRSQSVVVGVRNQNRLQGSVLGPILLRI